MAICPFSLQTETWLGHERRASKERWSILANEDGYLYTTRPGRVEAQAGLSVTWRERFCFDLLETCLVEKV